VHDHNIVHCLREDAHGNLWFGTGHGLYRRREGAIDRFGRQEGLSAPDVAFVFEDRSGTIRVVAGNRLHSLGADRRFHVLGEAGLKDAEVNCLFEDREANQWIGTRTGGLFRLRPEYAVTFTTHDGLSNDRVWSVCEGRDGQLWIATDGGVNEFKQGRFSPLPIELEVAGFAFRSVLEEPRGYVWLGSAENGVHTFIDHGPTSGHGGGIHLGDCRQRPRFCGGFSDAGPPAMSSNARRPRRFSRPSRKFTR
jgi:ligand-binding sensor domain-containing protein